MKNFYAIFKSVLATVVAASMLFVSCTEPYDDTAIRQEIADLYEKVSKLEEKLDNEVSALKTLIDTKTVVASATKNTDGSWEILLTSGEKITVYPEYKPAVEVNNGCVTVVLVDNVYYWAQIVDGAAVAITDNAGNKIPVSHNAAPEFRVNPTTGDVELSVDGGNTWVVVEKKAEESTDAACIFIGVVDGETSVDFTLASGEVISVPKAEAIDFGVQAGKTFVTPGESVDVALKADNIDDLTVIAKPEGWKAVINGKTLTITAPAQEKIDAGTAEIEGLVKIHAAGGDGKCMVGKLAVSASTQKVVVEVVGEELVIYNNVLDQWGESNPVFYGILPMNEFSAAAIAKGMNDYTVNYLYTYDAETKVALKDVYNQMLGNYDPSSYVEIPSGVSYAIWAISQGQNASYYQPYTYTENDVLFTVYTPAFLSVEATKVSFNAVEFTAVGGGYAGYIVGVLAGGEEAELKAQLENAFGYWQNDWGVFGEELTELNYKGNVLEFPGSTIWGGIYPNTNYMVYVLPLIDGKASSDYLATDLKTYLFTTSNIEAGGAATLSFEPLEIGYTNMEVAIKGSENTTMIYSVFAEADEIAKYDTDEKLLQYVIDYNTEYETMAMGSTSTASITSLNPGTTAYVCAFAVDSEGKYSQLYKQEFKTNELAYNETLKVVIDQTASKVETTTAAIKVSTTGGEAVSYRYMALETGGWSWKGEESAESSLALSNSYYIQTVAASDLVDGCINLTELTTNEEYAFAIIAVDAAGTPSRASFYYFTPKLPEYPLVRATADNYAAMKPTYDYSVAWNGDYGRFDVTVNVTPAAGTVKYWIAVLGEEYLSSTSVARDAVDYMILKEGQYYGSKAYTEAATLVPDYKVGGTYDVKANVWITWCDEAGNYYEAICEPIFTMPYVASTEASWTASEPTVVAELADNTLTYTVTPGAGATNMWIYAVPNPLYYDDDDLTYMLTINPDVVQSATEYSGTVTGVAENATIAVAWTDAAGNLYQVKKTVKP